MACLNILQFEFINFLIILFKMSYSAYLAQFRTEMKVTFLTSKFDARSFVQYFYFIKLKFRQTKKAEFQAINAIKYLQEIVQLEFGAF